MNIRKAVKPLAWLFGITLVVFIAAYSFRLPYLYPYTRWVIASWQYQDALLPNPLPNQRFADTWGAARSFGRKHEGVDIFAKRGTPIYSNIDGVVVKVGQNKLGGNIVSVLGIDGRVHYYAHLDEFGNVKRHQWIEKGTVIGTVGDTGNAKGTPPHLHYGIYTKTGAVNPYPLLKQ